MFDASMTTPETGGIEVFEPRRRDDARSPRGGTAVRNPGAIDRGANGAAGATAQARREAQRETRRETRPSDDEIEAEISDAELLARYADGDQAAARLLTERHLGRVLALATRMLSDAAEAEDVAQESMLRAWKMAPNWDAGGAKFSTWLHKVALNLCYDRLRRRRGTPLEDAPEPEDPTPSVEARMEADEGAGMVRQALAELPERQRAAILLRHFEERSNPEIADALEVSVEAVESLLARGRRALKDILTPRLKASGR